MKKYKHLFIDLDRTIWDFEKNAKETFHDIYNKYELKKKGVESLELFTRTYKKHNDLLWSYYRKGKILKEVLSVQRFELTLNDFDINDRKLALQIGNDYIKISPQKTNLFPYAHESLTYLKNKYILHLITNGFEEVQQTKIDVSDLRKYFKTIITSERAGAKKPEKKIFDFALKKAGAKLEESIIIGDDLKVDILGAKTFGMDQVYVNFDNIPHSEDITFEIDSLKKLQEIF
ncbi:MAG: YjjG family noncanonical pyrimidine nucleotidase, partial [Bacteroidales bacterium]|nr:YjjG family noncanonical pyrimidine nucleotidase [Bacteroidales bacterium]